MTVSRSYRILPLAGVLAILILALSACAATPTATPAPTATPTPTGTFTPPPKASEVARHSIGSPDAPVVVVDVSDFR